MTKPFVGVRYRTIPVHYRTACRLSPLPAIWFCYPEKFWPATPLLSGFSEEALSIQTHIFTPY